jgi:hypothetical protein
MLKISKRVVKRAINALGYDIEVRKRGGVQPSFETQMPDVSKEDLEIMERVRPFTMTSGERIHALIQAVRYVIASRVPGSIAECGVWRGGSMMAVAHTLLGLGRDDIDLYMFDTFEGMPMPTARDVNVWGDNAIAKFMQTRMGSDRSDWCRASLEDVMHNMASTGYGVNRMHFVPGKVETTLPGSAPAEVALLRLDTDWYESTLHEMEHLFPRLSPGGVIIIDDYGHWAGARQAVDEYLAAKRVTLLLNRIDDTGRMAIKC